MVPLKYLSNFWRILEIPLINCEITLQLTCSEKSILAAGTVANQVPKFRITSTKLYIPVVILSAQEKIRLLKQLESGFKRTINWNKYQSKKTSQAQNRYLDILIDPSFPGVNRFFVSSFKDDDGRKSYKQYYLPTVKIKDYNIVIDERNFFDKPIKNDLKTYNNIRKIATGQGDDCTTEYLLDYPYFKRYYKLIAIDFSKQQKLDVYRKAIQQIDFTGYLTTKEGARLYFIIEEAQETWLEVEVSQQKKQF